jgi:hypothetical protein
MIGSQGRGTYADASYKQLSELIMMARCDIGNKNATGMEPTKCPPPPIPINNPAGKNYVKQGRTHTREMNDMHCKQAKKEVTNRVKCL